VEGNLYQSSLVCKSGPGKKTTALIDFFVENIKDCTIDDHSDSD
jgi:hypothetical protein